MSRARSILIAACIAILPTASHAGPVSSFVSGANASALSSAFSLDGVAGYVEGRAREAMQQALSKEGGDWLCGAFADAINKARRGEAPIDLAQLFRQDAELRARVQADLKARLKEWLPKQAREIIARDILGNAVGEERLKEAAAIADRVVKELDTSLNDRIDAIVGSMYDSTIDRLKQEMLSAGIPSWVDPTDLRQTVKKAFDLATIADSAAMGFAKIVGDGTVAAIRGRMEDALGGNLPPEAIEALKAGPKAFEEYAARAEKYLPGNVLNDLKSSLLNQPILKLPTAAYASILGGTAAGHYARAFKGVTVDEYELQRAVEVTRVMVWQIQNKECLNLSIMQLGSLARDLAGAIGAGASFDAMIAKIKEPVSKIQGKLDKIDALIKRPIEDVRGELENVVGGITDELKNIQNELLGPLREGAAKIQAGLDRGRGAVEAGLPEGLNGLPANWEELKAAAGLENGLFGKAGDWKASDELRGPIDKVKSDLAKLNDEISDRISTAAAEALEGAHMLGPAAAILGVERSPLQNPSKEGALDPVLLHNGEYVQSVTDIVIPGRGLDFRFMRTYRGRSVFLGELGWRWTHSYAERLKPWNDGSRDGLTHIDEEGRKSFFRAQGEAFISPPGAYATLMRTDEGGFELSRREGLVTRFDKEGRPIEKRDRHGNRIAYEYDEGGLVSSAIDVFGRRIVFGRRKDGLISCIKDFAGRTISFEYNEGKELIGVRSPATPDFPKGKLTSYRYDRADDGEPRAHAIAMIMDPRGNVFLRNRYDDEGRVIAQQYGDGQWMRVQYEASPSPLTGEGRERVAGRAWVTDQLGIVRLYEHDANGHLLQSLRWDGNAYIPLGSYQYNDDGERVWECAPSGACTRFIYGEGPARGLAVQIEKFPSGDGAPRVTRIEREPRFGRTAHIVFSDNEETLFDYAGDAPWDLIAVKRRNAADAQWSIAASYSYDSSGQLTEETDARGLKTRYEYYPASDPDGDGVGIEARASGSGYLKAVAREGFTSFAYDPIGNVISTTAADGSIARFTVNALNQVVREQRSGQGPARYSFDANDNLVRAEIEREGSPVVYTFEYDVLDRMTKKGMQISEKERADTHYVYDATGALAGMTMPEGNATAYEYDKDGSLLCAVLGVGTPERSSECVERDADGNVFVHVDGSGVRTEYRLNGFGEVMAEIDALGNRMDYERDSAGRVVAARAADASGKLLAEERMEYAGALPRRRLQLLFRDDPANARWIEQRIDADNRETSASSRTQAKPVRRPAGGQSPDRYIRDKNNRLSRLIDANGNSTEFGYDALDRLVLERFPDGSERRTAYDGAGRVTGVIDRNGSSLAIAYDAAGRLSTRTAIPSPGAIGTMRQRFEHDGLGRLVLAVDENDPDEPDDDAISRFVYDSLSRPVAESSKERWIARSFDDAGKVSALELTGGAPIFFAYGSDGLVSSVLAGKKRIASISRDNTGHIARAALGERLTFESQRDASGQEVSRSYLDPFGKAVASWRMAFDGNGRVRTETDSLSFKQRSYSRDSFGRLVAVDETSPGGGSARKLRYEYDGVGNITTVRDGDDVRRMQYNALNELTGVIASEAIPLRYDANGNLISNGKYEYRYDALGRLVQVLEEGGLMADYKYDAFDRRIQESSADVDRELVWDGWRLAAEVTSDNGMEQFAYADGIALPIASLSASGTAFFIADRAGSARAKEIQGKMRLLCSYGPYGTEESCEHYDTPFGFAGMLRGGDPELMYARNRSFDPELMRFTQPDPLGYKIRPQREADVEFAPALSFHRGQGEASGATIPNRPLHASARYAAFPFGRAFVRDDVSYNQGEPGLYLYARGDPSTFNDPLGLASLIFERASSELVLFDGDGNEVSRYEAHNNVTNPKGDPLKRGDRGPFPDGTFALGVPEFYSREYRELFYERFGFQDFWMGESKVTGPRWAGVREAGYSISQGLIRFRVGAPADGRDRVAWDRQLFIHAGRFYNSASRTHGCIRARDDEIETLAANVIELYREDDPVTTLTVR
ncbi:MAG: DUF6531 domain-containing protein [bacterium]